MTKDKKRYYMIENKTKTKSNTPQSLFMETWANLPDLQRKADLYETYALFFEAGRISMNQEQQEQAKPAQEEVKVTEVKGEETEGEVKGEAKGDVGLEKLEEP